MKTAMILAMAIAMAGCAAHQNTGLDRAPERTVVSSLEPDWPLLKLKCGWNGETYQVPEPVLIPPDVIRGGYAAWERGGCNGNWPVQLADGRTAVMMAGRFKTSDPGILRFGVFMIWVYRPDGTLQMEQTNADDQQNMPLVNTPKYWTIYEADGKTRAIDVIAFRGKDHTEVCNVIYYRGGKQSREYNMSTDDDGREFVLDEYAYDEKGDRKGVHVANGYLGKVLLYNP